MLDIHVFVFENYFFGSLALFMLQRLQLRNY